jgi:hypothetical protein
MDQLKKKRVDPYIGVKFIGYRMSQLPTRYKMSDLVRYARFILAEKAGRLYKDPIFDSYTVEELLAEFFAHQFHESKEFRVTFEEQIGDVNGDGEDFADWADRKIAEDAKIRDKVMGGMEDKVSFNPSMVMGEED